MHPGGPPPPYPPPFAAAGRPARPAVRIVAGMLWAVAAAFAVGAQFGLLYRQGNPPFEIWFWWSRLIVFGERTGQDSPSLGGVGVLVATVVLVVAALLVFVTRRRQPAMIMGTFGAGMMLDRWIAYLTLVIELAGDRQLVKVGLGWWLLSIAALVAIAGFIVALTEQASQPASPQPTWSPVPAPQPPWPPPHPGPPDYGSAHYWRPPHPGDGPS